MTDSERLYARLQELGPQMTNFFLGQSARGRYTAALNVPPGVWVQDTRGDPVAAMLVALGAVSKEDMDRREKAGQFDDDIEALL